MVVGFAGASLEFLAITTVVTFGLIARNQVKVTLSHDIFALFFYSLVGRFLSRIAHLVASGHEHKRATGIRNRYCGMQKPVAVNVPGDRSSNQAGGSIASWGLPLPSRNLRDGRVSMGLLVERNTRKRKEQMV